jgi:hypothetical protein
MANLQGKPNVTSNLTTIPLAIAYVAIPLSLAISHFSGQPVAASTWLWVFLAGLGTIHAMLYRHSGVPIKKRFILEITMFLVLIIILVLYSKDIIRQLEAFTPYVSEAMPLVFLLFCALWIKTFGMPDRGDFQRYGALLGALCIVDLVAEIFLYQAVPTVRLIGNTDILAGLLLVSTCASLKPGSSNDTAYEQDQGHHLWRVIILIGIAACLSRTGLFAAAWIFLCFGRGRILIRTICAILFMVLIVLTLLLPSTPSDAIHYIDYWLWVEAIRLYAENPMLLFTGFPVIEALPITFPVGMGPVWEAATGSPSIMGIYLPQIPSFWLRLTLAWGIGAPLMLLVIIFSLLLRHLTRMGAGLIAALFAQGMTTSLLFDPSLAETIGFVFFLALSKPQRVANVKIEKTMTHNPAPEQKTLSESDPVEEWNMGPL